VELMTLGVVSRSRKENERRLPIHPLHVERIDADLRQQIYLESGYGEPFGCSDEQLGASVAGLRSREELLTDCDVVLLPKPLLEDVKELREGQILWGWPHCVQDDELTQVGIDLKLTIIAWEAMNLWSADGSFSNHVFAKNNQLAGYASVLHGLELIGSTGQYGRPLRAAVMGSGATGLGAVIALNALHIVDVDLFTHRDVSTLSTRDHSVRLIHLDEADDDPSRQVAQFDSGSTPLAQALPQYDIVVNCVLQDTDAPLMFLTEDELTGFAPGSLIVDVSCDAGMGFSWARPTSFADPMFTVGNGVHYYAVDHSPSLLWNSATWEISEALLPHLRTVLSGPDAWQSDETVRRAVELQDGVILNPRILSFQHRSPDYPHPQQSSS
jgi:alanine dehydrogenase